MRKKSSARSALPFDETLSKNSDPAPSISPHIAALASAYVFLSFASRSLSIGGLREIWSLQR